MPIVIFTPTQNLKHLINRLLAYKGVLELIEYIHNAIKATAGQPIGVTAKITKEDNTEITEDCSLMIYTDKEMLLSVDGAYLGNSIW